MTDRIEMKLQFRRATGEQQEVRAWVVDGEPRAGEFLAARWVELDDDAKTRLRQHSAVPGEHQAAGYLRLDNEILAGRRLHDAASGFGGYPAEVACLYGDDADSASPYALVEPYRGTPLRKAARQLLPDEFEEFAASLLTGLCWLAAAGIASRAINPDTVLWDGKRRVVQITDFSQSVPFGAMRTPVRGSSQWVPGESRPGKCVGLAGPADDVWAAGRLIYFAFTQGKDLANREQLADGNTGLDSMFRGLLSPVFSAPEGRPTASDLLSRGLRRVFTGPPAADRSTALTESRQRFLDLRERLRGELPPLEVYDDISWADESDVQAIVDSHAGGHGHSGGSHGGSGAQVPFRPVSSPGDGYPVADGAVPPGPAGPPGRLDAAEGGGWFRRRRGE
jgi:serine/threonine protein kinase